MSWNPIFKLSHVLVPCWTITFFSARAKLRGIKLIRLAFRRCPGQHARKAYLPGAYILDPFPVTWLKILKGLGILKTIDV